MCSLCEWVGALALSVGLGLDVFYYTLYLLVWWRVWRSKCSC